MNIERLRNKLGYTRAEAGQYILGIHNKKAAYDTWYRIETTGNQSGPVDQYFKLLEHRANIDVKALINDLEEIYHGF